VNLFSRSFLRFTVMSKYKTYLYYANLRKVVQTRFLLDLIIVDHSQLNEKVFHVRKTRYQLFRLHGSVLVN